MARLRTMPDPRSGECVLTGSFTPKYGNDFSIKGKIESNGLAIYYALYAELSLNGTEAVGIVNDKKKSPLSRTADVKRGTKDRAMLCELFSPWSFPSQKESANIVAACSTDANS
jgi:hypothetical protein